MDAETFAAQLRETLGPPPWCVDHVDIADGVLEMRGWALAPAGRQADLTFTVDDRDFAHVEYPLPRRDIEQVFWFHPGASAAAFRCRTPLDTIAFPNGYATLRCIRRDTRLPVRPEYDCYYPAPGDEPPLPDEERRRRVAGNPSAEVFRLEGFSTLAKLERALATVDASLLHAHNVLDWGCGSGRVTRYLPRFSRGRITGVDIDADNLEWCRRHLPFGDFRRVPLRPPTDFPADAFDVVIGISVCTHLREPEQVAWLGELTRLTAPGGYVLLTVLGGPNVTWSRFDANLFEEWRRRGFLAIGGNTDLKGHIDEDDYYVNTYMTERYVRQSWGQFFDVRAIIPGLIGNNQDLVVLHKPKSPRAHGDGRSR